MFKKFNDKYVSDPYICHMHTWADLHHKIDKTITVDSLLEEINNLPEEQRFVLEKYYGEQQSFRFIASQYNMPVSKVSRLHARAVHSLRMSLSVSYRKQIHDIASKVVISKNVFPV